MELLGTIEPTPGTSSGRNEWISLIGTHPALAPVPPRQGINPFTRGQVEFNPPPDSAQVMVKGSEVGRITWAEDESQLLVAWARATSGERRSRCCGPARLEIPAVQCHLTPRWGACVEDKVPHSNSARAALSSTAERLS